MANVLIRVENVVLTTSGNPHSFPEIPQRSNRALNIAEEVSKHSNKLLSIPGCVVARSTTETTHARYFWPYHRGLPLFRVDRRSHQGSNTSTSSKKKKKKKKKQSKQPPQKVQSNGTEDDTLLFQGLAVFEVQKWAPDLKSVVGRMFYHQHHHNTSSTGEKKAADLIASCSDPHLVLSAILHKHQLPPLFSTNPPMRIPAQLFAVAGDAPTTMTMSMDELCYAFPASAMEELPPEDWTIPDDERNSRVDLTHLTLVTIDPSHENKELDDALSLRKVYESDDIVVFEVGIHIADPSLFVRAGSELDLECRRRVNTIFTETSRSSGGRLDSVPMLPGRLGTDICSLRPAGVEKLAVSLLIEIEVAPNNDFRIRAHRLCKSIIRSRAQMTYTQVESILDEYCPSDIRDAIRLHNPNGNAESSLCLLYHVSKMIQRLREQHERDGSSTGALAFEATVPGTAEQVDEDEGIIFLTDADRTEPVFKLDPQSGKPLDIKFERSLRSQRMVAEYMTYINAFIPAAMDSMLQFVRDHQPKQPNNNKSKIEEPPFFNIIRTVSEPINPEKHWDKKRRAFRTLNEYLEHAIPDSALSVSETHSAAEFVETIQQALRSPRCDPDQDEFGTIRRIGLKLLVQRLRYRATYNRSSNEGVKRDYCPQYTHFTSPIRRYLDLLLHRELTKALIAMTAFSSSNGNGSAPPLSMDVPGYGRLEVVPYESPSVEDTAIAPDVLDAICERCSESTSAQRKIKDDIKQLYLGMFLRDLHDHHHQRDREGNEGTETEAKAIRDEQLNSNSNNNNGNSNEGYCQAVCIGFVGPMPKLYVAEYDLEILVPPEELKGWSIDVAQCMYIKLDAEAMSPFRYSLVPGFGVTIM